MIEDVRAALLGDHEAAKRLTEAGVLVPCMCGGKAGKARSPVWRYGIFGIN